MHKEFPRRGLAFVRHYGNPEPESQLARTRQFRGRNRKHHHIILN